MSLNLFNHTPTSNHLIYAMNYSTKLVDYSPNFIVVKLVAFYSDLDVFSLLVNLIEGQVHTFNSNKVTD